MPNHIHLIAVPKTECGLAKAIGFGHEAYTRDFNFKNNEGNVCRSIFEAFQHRVPMDDQGQGPKNQPDKDHQLKHERAGDQHAQDQASILRNRHSA